MPINRLYDTWNHRIRELRPGQRITQIRNFVWLISTGTWTIRDGLRSLVDRKDQPDLSFFQIGLRITERCVTNTFPFRIDLYFYH
jgi:hypothetical protein